MDDTRFAALAKGHLDRVEIAGDMRVGEDRTRLLLDGARRVPRREVGQHEHREDVSVLVHGLLLPWFFCIEQFPSAGTAGMPEVNPLPNLPQPDGADFYFFVLEKNANSQFFGSHFGQNGGVGDHVDGGTSRFDANGVIYQAL